LHILVLFLARISRSIYASFDEMWGYVVEQGTVDQMLLAAWMTVACCSCCLIVGMFMCVCKNQSRRDFVVDDESYLETDDQDDEVVAGAEWEDPAKHWVNR